MELFGSLLIIGLITLLIYMKVSKKERADKKHLPDQLDSFKQAIKHQDFKQIIEFGESLIYNSQLTHDIVLLMEEKVNSMNDYDSELDNLKGLIFNKRIYFEKSGRTYWNKKLAVHFNALLLPAHYLFFFKFSGCSIEKRIPA